MKIMPMSFVHKFVSKPGKLHRSVTKNNQLTWKSILIKVQGECVCKVQEECVSLKRILKLVGDFLCKDRCLSIFFGWCLVSYANPEDHYSLDSSTPSKMSL